MNSQTPARPESPAPIDRALWVLLGVVVAVCLWSWSRFFLSFEVPNTDFFSFTETAEAVYGGRVPENLKRMPGYPVVFGGLALFLPGERPHEGAAMWVNLTASALSLVVLFLLGRRVIGRAALVPVAALAATPMFSVMATQAMLEAWMGLLILLTFWLADRRSKWAYAAASWATLCRQECVVLVPIVWALALWDRPKDWAWHTGRAVLAGLPFVGWQLFVRWASGRAEGGDAYAQELAGMAEASGASGASGGGLAWNKVELMLTPFPAMPTPFAALLWGLAAVGVVAGLRRNPRVTLALLAFFGFYTAVHLVFGVWRLRYAYPVLFVTLFFAAWGGQATVGLLGRLTEGREKLRLVGGVAVGLLGLAWAANRWLDFAGFAVLDWQRKEHFLGLTVPMLLAAGAGVALAVRGRWPVRVGLGVAAAASLTGPALIGAQVRAEEQGYLDRDTAEYALAARWLAEHLGPGETAAMPRGDDLAYWDHLIDPGRVRDVSDARADDTEGYAEELRTLGVDVLLVPPVLQWPTDPQQTNAARDRFYYAKRRLELIEPFRGGAEVEGFTLVERLEIDRQPKAEIGPVWVYRLDTVSAEAGLPADE